MFSNRIHVERPIFTYMHAVVRVKKVWGCLAGHLVDYPGSL